MDRIARVGGVLASTLGLACPGEPADVEGRWAKDVPHQNLRLRVSISDELRDALAAVEWPTTIESEQTLLLLPGPR